MKPFNIEIYNENNKHLQLILAARNTSLEHQPGTPAWNTSLEHQPRGISFSGA